MRFSSVLVGCAGLLLAGCGALATSGGDPSGVTETAAGGRSPPASCHARGRSPFTLPDRSCTPGATDPAVTQANIAETICRRGYTATVRPPASVTEPEKRASMAAYGDTGSPRKYEYDHLIPLELGGAPNDRRNLWPEPGASPNRKDGLEGRLRSRVCRGQLRLAVAQHMIALDWVAAWRRFAG